MPMPPAKKPPPLWVAVNFYATRAFAICILVWFVAWIAHWRPVQSAMGLVEMVLVVILLIGRWRGAPLNPPTLGRK